MIMANNRKREFAEGVIFTFPGDLPKVDVERVVPELKPKGTKTFTPFRYVMTVRLFEMDSPEEERQDFGPNGFKMRVYFAQSDLDKVKDKDHQNLLLAFHDGTDWIIFDKDKHGYKTKLNDQGLWKGYATVNIKKWEDPAMGWGP
jgi:hypothetical protein